MIEVLPIVHLGCKYLSVTCVKELPQYLVFEEGKDSDLHIKEFLVACMSNGIMDLLCTKNLFGTTTKRDLIEWYMEFITKNPNAMWEKFVKDF